MNSMLGRDPSGRLRHWLLGALLALWAGPVAAQVPDQPRSVVLMLPELEDDRDERAEVTIAAHLQDAEIDLLIRRYDPASFELGQLFTRSDALLDGTDARGILWVGLGQDLTLYVLVRGESQLHGRRIDGSADGSDPDDGLGDPVALESLANITATAAIAVAEGQPIVLHAPEPGPSVDPERPDAGSSSTPSAIPEARIEVTGVVIPKLVPRAPLRVGYRGQTYASGLPWLSAAELAVGWRPVARAHLELAYEASTPVTAEAASIGLQLQLFRVPVALAGGYRFELRRGWALELAGRLSVEPTRRRTIATGELLVATDPRWRAMAGAGLDLRSSVALRDDVRVWMGLGLIGMFVRSDYVVADIEQPLLHPSAVRVTAGLGVEFDLIHR
ncbi:hypothetical protein [Enhygromyxa salina]|uniref:Uncharacterized protein n=1 Tax=Enhygromyxa salina TaxID=215803 RepID=A0A2S9YM14_9BACT|nr:hypothetical protein [Enhygromyxa salina]PRQ06147.1 hypothetical protein ENSA7_41810 [Enhygromyxa salina]